MNPLIEKHQAKIREISDAWQFCGCGSDGGKWGIVLWVLEHAHHDEWKSDNFFAYLKAHPETERWVEFAVQVVDKMGLLEHGSSWTGSWLDGHGDGIGAAMLAFLREHGTTPDGWPDWALDDVHRRR